MKRGGRRPVGWVESTRVNTPRDWWRQLSVPAKGKTEAELLAFKSKLVPAIAPDGTIEDQNALAAAYSTPEKLCGEASASQSITF